MTDHLNHAAQVSPHFLKDDGLIPNNKLPLLVYQGVLEMTGTDPAAIAEAVFASNLWGGSWRNGIFTYHHYHSTAHEVLAICRGQARVKLGGEQGVTLEVQPGDVIAIPAGGGHKNLGASSDLLVVGAYPPGQTWDLCRGQPGEYERAIANIARVPLPPTDPVFGNQGALIEYWLAA